MDILFIPLLAGLALASYGLYSIWDFYQFDKHATKAHGVILRYEEDDAKDRHNGVATWYRPHFQFTVDGETFNVQSKAAFPSKVIPVGRFTDVLYVKGDEMNAKLAHSHNSNMGFFFVFLSLPAIYFSLV